LWIGVSTNGQEIWCWFKHQASSTVNLLLFLTSDDPYLLSLCLCTKQPVDGFGSYYLD